MTDHRLYIIVREDLPSLNPGKAMAQVCHAGSQAAQVMQGDEAYGQWLRQADNFGTTIVLSEDKYYPLKRCISECQQRGFNAAVIVDPTYPFLIDPEIIPFLDVVNCTVDFSFDINTEILTEDGKHPATRKEETCGWVFVREDEQEKWQSICGHLELHK